MNLLVIFERLYEGQLRVCFVRYAFIKKLTRNVIGTLSRNIEGLISINVLVQEIMVFMIYPYLTTNLPNSGEIPEQAQIIKFSTAISCSSLPLSGHADENSDYQIM